VFEKVLELGIKDLYYQGEPTKWLQGEELADMMNGDEHDEAEIDRYK